MQRSLGVVSVLAACCLATSLHAQSRTNYNAARLVSTPNPSALDQPVGVSVGISSQIVIGDIAVGRGALRLLGWQNSRSESYGLGYGAPVISDSLRSWIRWSLGGELNAGYFSQHLQRGTLYAGNPTSVNAQFSIPLALHLGNDRWFSLSPYIAPYAEIGRAPTGYWSPDGCIPGVRDGPCTQYVYADHYTTHRMAALLGARLTVWRLALDLTYVEVARRFQGSGASPALSVRF